MKKVNQTKTVAQTIVSTYRLELDRDGILELLRETLGAGLPNDSSVDIWIQVPGGGDWSGENLDLSTDNPLVIQWQQKEEQVTHEELPLSLQCPVRNKK
jgi:hypothetical protein